MKKTILTVLVCMFVICAHAQIGIGTTTPNSTLDVRGSIATSYRAFTTATTATATDNLLVFTGTTAVTLTLPTAVGCDGRTYMIKNASTTGPTPVLTIATTSSQTIDGSASRTLTSAYETITVISNGANWNISATSLPGGSGVSWSQDGNAVASQKSIGTTSNYSLPFITNNVERMRLSNAGNLGIGTSTFNATNPEKLVVDAGTTTSVNAIVGKGSIDNYLQLNIQNNSAGANASSDVVATANNGSETTNYVDMGINGGSNTSGVMGVANDAYLYNIGQNMLIGTGTAAKSLVFMTGGTNQSANERMRIDGSGNVGIGNNNPAYKLQVNAASNPLYLGGVQSGTNTDSIVTIQNGVVKKIHPNLLPGSNNWLITGNSGINPATNFLGTTDDKQMILKSNGQSFLEFGRRQTLGLTQGYTDYDNNDEKVTYIRSALQFEAPGADFYKPKMFTDANGNFRVKGSSAGTDFFEFGSTGSSNSGGFEFIIGDDGDEPMVFKSYHYLNGMSEIMRLQSGRMAVGSNAFNVTNPEKLLIDAGVTTSYNLMTGKGSIDNYLQINVQNRSNGTSASSDLVATADNGTETSNYIDMGVNSSGYNNSLVPVLNGINNTYLYGAGNDFTIGNLGNNKPLIFFTTPNATQANAAERMRIDGSGNVGIGTTSPTQKLDVSGNMRLSGAFMPGNSAGTAGHILQSNGAGLAPSWIDASGYISTETWMQGGNTFSAAQTLGTISNHHLPIITNNTERMRISTTGDVAIGTTTFNGTNPEQLLVDAGTTTSVNAIVGKGSIDSYLQLNIQNNSAGTFASSDVVATANNGSETTNYIDMGVNGGNYTGGVMGAANDGYLYNMGQNLLIGTGTAAKSVVFMTGGTSQAANERMRINGTGDVAIGTSTFNGTNPEQLLVNAPSPAVITDFQNVIVGKGNTNSYAQLNIQNMYSAAGNSASSDVVATSDNGSESVNFIDMGINSGTNTTTGILGGGNTAYLYSTGNNFAIGNATAAKDITIFTGGTAAANERMRIMGSGNVGIGNTNPNSTLSVTGSHSVSYRSGTGAYTVLATDYVVINTGGSATWTMPAASTCAGRVYRLLNQGTANITLSAAVTTANAATTTTLGFAAGSNSMEIISDGSVWRLLK